MLFSVAVILVAGLALGTLCKKIRIPGLFGMIIAGILIGPYCLNLIDGSILNVSAEIRRIALIIILIRAGLKLNLDDLKKVGRPAILMCFVPACLEMIGMVTLAPIILGMSRLDAAILGAVIGAVSPAVVVPRMIKLIDEGYGVKQGIPQMILAGASVDDVFVIVMFTAFTGLAQGKEISVMSFVNIPLSIALGILAGAASGYLVYLWFSGIHMNLIIMTMLLLSVSFGLSTLETGFPMIPFASLIAIMTMGIAVKRADSDMAIRLSGQYDKLWTVAEIFLFVLVGASVAIDHAKEAGIKAIVLVLLVLVFRMFGVFLCVLGTRLSFKEKLFCMIAYTPKATVQAAIGGIPLAMGLDCGVIVLTVSVVAILLTAPIGAFGIDMTYRRWLAKNIDG
ncbi:MAG: cation:proton antiporter [Lachnospiraceae bacterium]|nr:cation:proton antiporter [Lachnospiraceae bacterium]